MLPCENLVKFCYFTSFMLIECNQDSFLMYPFKEKKPGSKSSALICHACLCRKYHLLTRLVCIYPCLTLTTPDCEMTHLPSASDNARAVSGVAAGNHWWLPMLYNRLSPDLLVKSNSLLSGQGRRKGILLFLISPFAFPLIFYHRQTAYFVGFYFFFKAH